MIELIDVDPRTEPRNPNEPNLTILDLLILDLGIVGLLVVVALVL